MTTLGIARSHLPPQNNVLTVRLLLCQGRPSWILTHTFHNVHHVCHAE